MGRTWRRIPGGMLLGVGLLLLGTATVRGQAPPEDDWKARLERLEEMNRQLQQTNQQLLKRIESLESSPAPKGMSVPIQSEEAEQGAPVDKGAVQKIVSDYLKSEDEKKKKAEEDKKKAEADTFIEVGKDLTMKARWDYGLWGETADKSFRVHVGGRTQFDAIWMSAQDNVQFGVNGTGPVRDGVNFRRARLEVDGTMYEVIDWWCEYDFFNTANVDPTLPATQANTINVPAPTDLWVTFTHLPVVGNIRVGNQKPPISFEHLTSSRFLNFLERSFAFDAFIGGLDNGFRPGISAFSTFAEEHGTWAIGIFKNQNQVFGWNVGDGETDVTARVTYLPYYEHDGRCLVHVGLGASHRDADEDTLRYRARTLLRNGPAVLQTVMADARMLASGETLLVPEFVMQFGPFLLQSEFFGVWAQDVFFPIAPTPGNPRVRRGTCFFPSYYVEALYFLTGEHRDYNRRTRETNRQASWGRVVPYENFFCVRDGCRGLCLGRGAWQVGARYSYADLVDNGVFGGVVHDVTLGLNWFLNGNMKVQWNYIWEYRDLPVGTSNGQLHGFGMRLAYDF